MHPNQNLFPWQSAPSQQPAPTGYAPPQAGIAPLGAGSPVPQGQMSAGYGPAPAGYGPAPAGYGPAPAGYGPQAPAQAMPTPGPALPFGDPFAAVASAALTRGAKLFYKSQDLVLAEIMRCKLVNGQKGLAFVIETRVLWSAHGQNAVGSEPGVVLRQGVYFGSEVKTWMCALMGMVATRDKGEIAKIDAMQGQWSELCSLACYSPDRSMQGPGPFAGTVVLLDCYRKPMVDRTNKPVIDPQTGQQKTLDLVRPEAVNQAVGESLRYLRVCANPAQDPQAERAYGVVKAALERRLDVPAYDPQALAARIRAAQGGGSAPAAQGYAPVAPMAGVLF